MALTVREVAAPIERATPSQAGWRALAVAMRPQQWTKNLIVFAAPLFGLKLSLHIAEYAALAFVAFCAISSATYLANDLIDRRADRLHPVKRSRPIASGLLPARHAVAAAVVLAVGGGALGALISPLVVLAIGIYAGFQMAYNLWLKREPILDVMCVSGGFVTRALAGAAAASVLVSTWFLLCVALLATFLAIEKRRSELSSIGDSIPTRAVLKHYTLPLLSRIEDIVVATGLISYSLWAAQRTEKHWMLVTVPLVAYVVFKYQMLTQQGAGEEPEMVLLKSPALMIAIALWIVACVGILVFQGHGAPFSTCSELC